MNKNGKKKLFDNKKVVLAASVLLALLSWVIVAGFINPGKTKTIPNVRIDYQRREEDYIKKGLQIVSDQKDYTFTDVMVSGESIISGFTNTDVLVYMDFSAVNGPGTHMIPLKAEKVAGGNYFIEAFSVKNSEHSLRRSPLTSVPVTFETVESKTFEVKVKAENVTASDDYFKDAAVLSVPEVTITGPASEVARVAQVVAVIDDSLQTHETQIYSSVPLTLYDASETPFETDLLQFSPSDHVDVTIPILEVKSIELGVGFIGTPQGFDTEWFMQHVSLTQNEIEIIGNSTTLTNLSEPYIVAEFDVMELSPGWESEPITIEFPEGVRSNDNISQVAARLDSSDMSQKTFDVSNLRIVNTPPNATVEPLRDSLSVTLMGDESQLEELLPENIVVTIDAFNISAARSGQQSIPARIVIPSANRVFATGNYSVVCDIEVS